MKKILFVLIAVLTMNSLAFAQTPAGAGAKNSRAKAERKEAPQQTEPKAAPAGAPTKKDGTPDMRHKANKDAAKPAQKLKKDGTPDMRYKENKGAGKK